MSLHPVSNVGAVALISETIVPTGGAASIDWQNIPQNYRHLQIYVNAQTENAALQFLVIRFNNDSSAIYYSQRFEVTAATTAAAEQSAQTSGWVGRLPDTSEAQGAPGIIDIPDYSAALTKVVTASYGSFFDSANRWGSFSTAWGSTAAITRITLLGAASDIKEASRFTLYGIS